MATNRMEVDSVLHTIRTIFESLLRLLLPAQGRHRSPGSAPAVRCEAAPTLAPPRQQGLFRGENVALLCPDVKRQERRLQRGRRRALWLASHGIDAGPRRIHGMEVAS